MTPALSKFVFVMLAIGWYLIRYEYARRSRREKVLRSDRGPRETALLLISLTGLGIVPFIYVATAIPHFAAYNFHPVQAWLGLFVAIAALVMFQLTHRALGRNWSDQSRRAGAPSTRHGRHLSASSGTQCTQHSGFGLSLRHYCFRTGLPAFPAWSGLGFCFLAALPGKSE